MDNLVKWGMNCVRLYVAWAGVAPVGPDPTTYNQRFVRVAEVGLYRYLSALLCQVAQTQVGGWAALRTATRAIAVLSPPPAAIWM
jgi:hypothetical protein